MDEKTLIGSITFSNIANPNTWDIGEQKALVFSCPSEAKRGEELFTAMQEAAFKAGREAGMREAGKEAEMYRWLRDWLVQNNLLTAMNCKPSAAAPNGDYWILRAPVVVSGDSCVGYGKDEDAAILSAIGGGQ